MITINQRVRTFLFAIIVVAMPVHMLADQIEDEKLQESSEVWYKRTSVQKIASGIIVTAIAAYAIAVHMKKATSPIATLTPLVTCKPNEITISTHDEESANKNNQLPHQILEDIATGLLDRSKSYVMILNPLRFLEKKIEDNKKDKDNDIFINQYNN